MQMLLLLNFFLSTAAIYSAICLSNDALGIFLLLQSICESIQDLVSLWLSPFIIIIIDTSSWKSSLKVWEWTNLFFNRRQPNIVYFHVYSPTSNADEV